VTPRIRDIDIDIKHLLSAEGRFSRGLVPSEIEEHIPTRKAKLNKRQLRLKELALKAEISKMLNKEDAHFRFRHVRPGEKVVIQNDPRVTDQIRDKGDFTFASVDLPSGEICIGVARCSPVDQFNRVYGRVKALKRLKELLSDALTCRWGLVITADERPTTGWTIGAVKILRAVHQFEDGHISGDAFDKLIINAVPFIRPKTVKDCKTSANVQALFGNETSVDGPPPTPAS